LTEEHVSSERITQLTEEFVETLGCKTEGLIEGTARLLITAVADEKSGVEFAVSSLQDWLTDVEGLRKIAELRDSLTSADSRYFDTDAFEAQWPKAVEQTIRKARQN
jgi:hypothetical protein